MLSFDNWARASMKNRSAVPILLPHEVDGRLSLFVGFHGTTENDLLGTRANYGQSSPGPGFGGGNYVFAKGFLADGPGIEE